MNTSKPNSRCRPGLGTLIRVQVDNEALIEPIYRRIGEIEKIFNFHDAESELSRFNRAETSDLPWEFHYLKKFADQIRHQSDGAFTPYVEEQDGTKFKDTSGLKMDLGGLAKGFAVDEAVETAKRIDANAKGFIEAGGDLRYFGETKPCVFLRLGVPPKIFTRELKLVNGQTAVASSSAGMAEYFGDTKTKLKFGIWPEGASVTIIADKCQLADAATKVVLFGGVSALAAVAPQVTAFVFDRNGETLESLLP